MASTDAEKAEVFSDIFYRNTCIPDDFPVNSSADTQAYDAAEQLLEGYTFSNGCLVSNKGDIGSTVISSNHADLILALGSTSVSSPGDGFSNSRDLYRYVHMNSVDQM